MLELDQRQKLTEQCNDISKFMQESPFSEDVYFNDWNTLMRVVTKIEESEYTVTMENNTCTIVDNYGKVIASQVRDTKKWATFHCVHMFVKKLQNIQTIPRNS